MAQGCRMGGYVPAPLRRQTGAELLRLCVEPTPSFVSAYPPQYPSRPAADSGRSENGDDDLLPLAGEARTEMVGDGLRRLEGWRGQFPSADLLDQLERRLNLGHLRRSCTCGRSRPPNPLNSFNSDRAKSAALRPRTPALNVPCPTRRMIASNSASVSLSPANKRSCSFVVLYWRVTIFKRILIESDPPVPNRFPGTCGNNTSYPSSFR